MGTHWYQCPICRATQQVKAQAGEVVTVEACQGCRDELAARDKSEDTFLRAYPYGDKQEREG